MLEFVCCRKVKVFTVKSHEAAWNVKNEREPFVNKCVRAVNVAAKKLRSDNTLGCQILVITQLEKCLDKSLNS